MPGLLLLIGALVLPTVVLAFILQDNVSTGGRAWELAVTAVHLPLALARALLGWAVWGSGPPGRRALRVW
jgi:hypothetical protein